MSKGKDGMKINKEFKCMAHVLVDVGTGGIRKLQPAEGKEIQQRLNCQRSYKCLRVTAESPSALCKRT